MARCGRARLGAARLGMAGQGEEQGRARQGWAWPGAARQGKEHGTVRLGTVGQGGAWNMVNQILQEGKQMSEGRGKLYFGGIPTEPDVNLLMRSFDINEMNPGYTVDYSKVSEIINQRIRSSRWRTVTMAWRKRLEKGHGIFLDCDPDKQAFFVLSEGGKVGLSGKKLRSSIVAARRSYVVSGHVDAKKLSEDEKRHHEFYSLRAGNILASAQLRMKKNTLPEITDK